MLEQELSQASPTQPNQTPALPEMVGRARWTPDVPSNQLNHSSLIYTSANAQVRQCYVHWHPGLSSLTRGPGMWWDGREQGH